MKNFSFYVLENQLTYSVSGNIFNIERSKKEKESPLYLKSVDKFYTEQSIFNNNQYQSYIFEDIHVTVLPKFENDKPQKKSKNSSPFHITLVLGDTNSSNKIVIHDFYSFLDLSRDFHIQLHTTQENTEPTITYLSKETIDLKQLDLLIEKEMLLIQDLQEKNNTKEQELLNSIKAKEDYLYIIAAQAYNFNEAIDAKDYEEFIFSLNLLIKDLEELVYLGHEHEIKRLENFKSELERWNKISNLNVPLPENIPSAAQPLKKNEESHAKIDHKKKSNSKAKSDKSNAGQTQKKSKLKVSNEAKEKLDEFLNNYYKTANDLLVKKTSFLNKLTNSLNLEPFDPQHFLKLCDENLNLFKTFTKDETENLVLKFFAQFAICQVKSNQIICKNIAEFLSTAIPNFQSHIRKVSMVTYPIFGVLISGILLSYLANNVCYWEYMHEYGLSFADRRHIIYDNCAGNILNGLFILLKWTTIEQSQTLVTYIQLLFKYLEEDNIRLSNMAPITSVLTTERKKISAHNFFAKFNINDESSSFKHFKESIMTAEPYGTFIIMDAIEKWLERSKQNYLSGVETAERERLLMPILVNAFIEIAPHATTESVLKNFERLLSLDVLEMFDDSSYEKLFFKYDEPAINLLSNFSLKYVGKEFESSIDKLLQFFNKELRIRAQSSSNTNISTSMQSYFQQSMAYINEINLFKQTTHDENSDKYLSELTIKRHKQLTLARLAYFLFSIKAQQEAHLTVDDYRVMLHFYRCYLATEIARFEKDSNEYQLQRKVCLKIMEESNAAINRLELLPDVKTELLRSSEYLDLLDAYNILKNESDNEFKDPYHMSHNM